MDIWGDPWTDDTKLDNAETKEEFRQVKAPTGILSSFEDEAGWGDFEDSTESAWVDSTWDSQEARSREDEDNGEDGSAKTVKGALELQSGYSFDTGSKSPGWRSQNPPSPTFQRDATTDLAVKEVALRDHIEQEEDHEERLVEDRSFTPGATTSTDQSQDVKLLDRFAAPEPLSTLSKTGVSEDHTERPSSPSEASATEDSKSSESLRTSFEDHVTDTEELKEEELVRARDIKTGNEDIEFIQDPDVFEKDTTALHTSITKVAAEVPRPQASGISQSNKDERAFPRSKHGPEVHVDLTLLNSLFKPPIASKRATHEADENLISSTSSRKTWYRLARQQTLREFNEGGTDDNYVRVAWPASNVRKEMLKIVSRWSSEVRVDGQVVLGVRSGAGFGWEDQTSQPGIGAQSISAPRKSTLSGRNSQESTLRSPTKQSHTSRKPSIVLQSNSAGAGPVAQFSWSSSPSTSPHPTKDSIPVAANQLDAMFGWQSSASSPGFQHPRKQSLRPRETRPVSVQLSHEMPPFAQIHRRSVTSIHSQTQPFELHKTSSGQQGLPKLGAIPIFSPAVPSAHATKIGQEQAEAENVNAETHTTKLSKLDTTDATLSSVANDESDDEWGDLVKSPSPQQTPIEPSLRNSGVFDLNWPKDDAPSESIPKARKPSPIVPPPIKQPIPTGFLSPARKAAFNAARVTRTLSSQHMHSEPLADDADLTQRNTPSRSPSTYSPSDRRVDGIESFGVTGVLGSSQGQSPTTGSAHPIMPELQPEKSTSQPPIDALMGADLSIFDTIPNVGPAIIQQPHIPQQNVQPTTVLTSEGDDSARRILQGLPDLSYMLL